ncbi:MAG: hypothetical protein ACOX5Z_01775 [Desulfobulbus sp.]|jgi:hypothetical protein
MAMIRQPENFRPETVKEVRQQLALSQEGLAHALGGELRHGQLLGERQDHSLEAGAAAVRAVL